MQKLKLSDETVSVLKNFNQINPNIYFRQGSVISTVSPGKTIFARYDCAETFETDFGIYRLDKILSVMSFFAEPVLEIGDKSLSVRGKGQKAHIAFADPNVLIYPKSDTIKLPAPEAEFVVTEEQLEMIKKAYSVMTLPYVSFESDGKDLVMKALDIDVPHGDTYTIDLASTDKPNDFQVIFDINNLRLIPASYKVELSMKGKVKIAKFSNDKLTYWIGVHKDSRFGE
jgi:hypothetical protein